jgi:hypothetical protein
VAIKEWTARWVRGKPVRAIAWVAGVGLVAGVVVGVGAGFKIEQHRVNRDVARLRTQLSGGTRATTPKAKSKVGPGSGTQLVRRVGTVTTTGTNTITVATKHHGSVLLHVAGSTPIELAVKGGTADITAGRSVLVAKGAHTVLVLATGRRLGRRVTGVANGVASVATTRGVARLQLSKIQTVDTTSTATPSDIKTGSQVLTWVHPGAKGTFDAVEVIVLPAGSAFA